MFFKKPVVFILNEGGNLSLPNPNDPNSPYEADEIDLTVHNRSFMVGLLDKLLHDINGAFYAQTKKPLWNPQLLQSKEFLGGSSLHFFNTKGISDKEFVKHKPKVGDIDTQCNKELEPDIQAFLTSMNHKQIGDAVCLGFSKGSEQLNSLFEFQDPPIKIQIDFEFGRYDPETDTPDEWYRFSHSSEWNDIQAGVKGVFHKYIYRALTSASGSVKHQVDVLKTKTNIKPNTADNDLSFSVASGKGGGLSHKYEPYIHTDPATGQKVTHADNVPYKRLLPPAERTYIQKLDQQFIHFFGKPPEGNDGQLQKSFLGTLDLINKYLEQPAKEKVFLAFVELCFEIGGQMITKNDPARDREIKFAAIDQFVEKCKLKPLRKQAIDMATAYENDHNEVQAYKQAHPEEKQPRAALKRLKAAGQPTTESINEAEVKAQLRKGMPHLHDLKPADLLDLLDEIHDGNGRFKLQNIPLNVKVDGFGGRFGKNADGKPFMGTSRTEPRYQAGFVDYHQKKGTTDPEILGRAKLFDDLFNEMMKAVQLVDNKLGPDFLVDKQVTCEVLYLPFAAETPEGKLKFVGIHYDKLPEGVQLALVPFRVSNATTGEDLPDANEIVKKLTGAGRIGSVMFIDNSLTQNKALDVTAIVPPVENIDQIKSMLASGKLAQKREAKELLAPVAIALEKAIIEDPNIIGKDMLGQDYEGIVINSRLGPIKVTSQEQRDVISAKNAAKVSARTERPRGESKTAVVAVGSLVGHMGHQQLFSKAIALANKTGGDPYLFIGNAEGKDDPIPPAVKVQTWNKLYPQYAKIISTVDHEGGSLLQKIKHELINPLPGKPPRYDTVWIVVGKDREVMAKGFQASLMKVTKFPGYEHVKIEVEATERDEAAGGSGMSFTKMRQALSQSSVEVTKGKWVPTGTAEQKFAFWNNGFNGGNYGAQKLPPNWIKHLMDISGNKMQIQPPAQPPAQQPAVQQPTVQQPAPVAERLFNALVRPRITVEDQSGEDINHLQKELWDLHKEVTGYRPRPGVVDWTQEQWNNPEFLKHMITKLTQQLFPQGDSMAEGSDGTKNKWYGAGKKDAAQGKTANAQRHNSKHPEETLEYMRGYKSVKQDVEEGWKSTLAGAALAGLGALGSGGAHAGGVSLNPDQGFQPQDQVTLNQRVQQQQNRQDLSSYSTDYLQKAADPNRFGRFMVSVDDAKAELQARENGKQQKVSPATTEKPTNGFSKDYLEKAADPQRFGRFLISVEKAQELLKKYSEVDEVTLKTTPYGRTAASQQRAAAAHAQFEKDWAKKQEAEKQKQGEKKPEQAVAEITGDGNFDNMMGKITDPAERERLAPIEVQQVVKFLKGSIESLLELLKNDPDFEPGDVRYNTDLRDMRKNLKSIMADSDPENVAAALFNYETEWRETMNGWAEEALGHALFSKLENLYYGEYGESLAEQGVGEDSEDVMKHVAKGLTGPGAPSAKLRAAGDAKRRAQGSRSYGFPQKSNLKTPSKLLPIGEHYENIMGNFINKMIVNEAIQNNRR